MSQSLVHTHHLGGRRHSATTTVMTLVAALTLPLVAIALPAAAGARPEPAPTVARIEGGGQCPLERIGTQLVRCDDLTGAGALAPSWVPVQRVPFRSAAH